MAQFNTTGKINGLDLYPAIDRPRLTDNIPVNAIIAAYWSGDFRAPQQDEWYLAKSPVDGSIEARRAPRDLDTVHHLATLVIAERVESYTARVFAEKPAPAQRESAKVIPLPVRRKSTLK